MLNSPRGGTIQTSKHGVLRPQLLEISSTARMSSIYPQTCRPRRRIDERNPSIDRGNSSSCQYYGDGGLPFCDFPLRHRAPSALALGNRSNESHDRRCTTAPPARRRKRGSRLCARVLHRAVLCTTSLTDVDSECRWKGKAGRTLFKERTGDPRRAPLSSMLRRSPRRHKRKRIHLEEMHNTAG